MIGRPPSDNARIGDAPFQRIQLRLEQLGLQDARQVLVVQRLENAHVGERDKSEGRSLILIERVQSRQAKPPQARNPRITGDKRVDRVEAVAHRVVRGRPKRACVLADLVSDKDQ